MTRLLLRTCALGLLVVGLTLTTQAQDDIAPTGDGPVVVSLHPSIPLAARGGLLYDNGPLVNSAGTGVGGADESVLQTTSLSMSTLGFGHQVSAGNRIADDFDVPDPGWDVVEIYTYAYQTGSPTTSTITDVNLQIWDGSPDDAGSTVVFGDDTTNRLASTSWSNIYRVTETSTGTSADRPIMENQNTAVVTLATGTYWLDWQTGGSLASGPWAPPITLSGNATTGNALQFTTGWAAANDGGSGTPQGFPFQVYGTEVPVELTSFSATANGSAVVLSWATASETNNAGFEVQLQDGDAWTALGFVTGNGTTTEAQTYSFTASGLGAGTHVFRLKQIDFDGAFEYHGEVEATIGVVGTHELSSAYPNPFNPSTQFTLAVAQTQPVTVAVYNALGQRVATLFEGTLDGGQSHAFTFEAGVLPSGLYLIQAQGEAFSATQRVTLLK